jgi:hypothetical protein
MRRWDLLLVVGLVCAVVAAGGVDWRLGAAVLAVALVLVWYWLREVDDDEVS